MFLKYKENQMGSGAKSYMSKGFLIQYMKKMRKYLTTVYMRRPSVIRI
jgi:hypothetical protein